MSKRRHYVATTSVRDHFDVKCLLGHIYTTQSVNVLTAPHIMTITLGGQLAIRFSNTANLQQHLSLTV